ncbi:MAG: hypothetical protein ABIP51_21560 [Bacteroidia bacterium]
MSISNKVYENLQFMLEKIKNSSFLNLFKKECQKDDIFTIQNNYIQKPKIYKIMYNDSQKKSMIYQMTLILLVADNSTTNLDIKNALHNVFPGIGLTQLEVSTYMAELSKEKTDWKVKNNGRYNEYIFDQTASPVHVDITKVSVVPATVAIPAPGNSTTDPTNLMAIVKKPNGKTVSLGKIGAHSTDFLKKINGNVKVAFAVGFEPCLINTVDKYEARKLFKTITGAKHNSVRTITIKTYLKRNGIK